MPEPEAILNGQFVPQSAAVVPVYDAGFVLGTTVAEQMRTFGGKLFRLQAHLDRLAHSLAIVGVDPGVSLAKLEEQATELARRNHSFLAAGDDLCLTMFITPGAYPTMTPVGQDRPTVCLHTFPIPFRLWADSYEKGQSLVTTSVMQVPEQCWPVELKCRSRMHYYLADQEARRREPQARALMLDQDGFITESTTANIVLYRTDEGINIPPMEKILPGISMAVLKELAIEAGVACRHRDLTPQDVAKADEVWLCSTSPCLLPVVRFNGTAISDGTPGAMFKKLLEMWGRRVGTDILSQSRSFAIR